MDDRRQVSRERPRFPVQLALTLREFDRDVAGRLLDVSESGVGIETYVELPAGARVSLRAALSDGDIDLCFDCSAQVRHCRRLDSGLFRAGLEVVNVCWSRKDGALTLIEA